MSARYRSDPSHLPLALAARPARLGLFVRSDIRGLPWPVLFEAALAAQSRFWGGSGNLIFPLTNDFHQREIFWALADIFDADSYVLYAPTWSEMAEIVPEYYKQETQSWRQRIEKTSTKEAADEFISRSLTDVAIQPEQPSSAQMELLQKRLAPFHKDSRENLDWFNAANTAPWPFTDISEFLELPESVTNPYMSLGTARKLLLTATTGRVPPIFASDLTQRNTQVVNERINDSYTWTRVMRDPRPQENPPLFPWGLAAHGLGTYRHGPIQDTPAALVIGDSPWDFVLFYALRRMTGAAWWLPSWLARDHIYLHWLAHELSFGRRFNSEGTVVTSASRPSDDGLRKRVPDLFARNNLDFTHWRKLLPEQPLRLYERDNEGRQEMTPIVSGATVELKTPLPKRVSTETPTMMHWIAEIQGEDWAPLRHPTLSAKLISDGSASSDMTRTTRDGVAYYPLGTFTFGGASLESSVSRPRLTPLSLADQIGFILRQQGWRCELSDKGIWASESAELFGGFEPLCSAVRNPSVRGILNAYLTKTGPGLSLSSDRRRYLEWEALEQACGSDNASKTIDSLLESGVLARGLVLKCGRCRQKAWHRSPAASETFTCERCHHQQLANRESWLGKNEPTWSYQMAEVLFHFLDNNGHLPLLAIQDEFEASRRPLAQACELSIRPPGCEKDREVDIFSANGYRLWIGEATKTGGFDKGRLEFLVDLADAVSAYGVLLATSKHHWSESTEAEARALFGSTWPRLVLRTNVKTKPLKPNNGD